MLALLSTFIFAAAATFALGAGIVTFRGRRGQIAGLIADYRSIQRDREFLIHVTSHEPVAPRAIAAPQLRRTARRQLTRTEVAQVGRSRAVA